MTIWAIAIYLATGVCAGLLSGLLGIGGGLVTVPVLLVTFNQLGFPAAHSMQMAVGTSLGAMVFTAASSAWAHWLQRGIYWPFFFPLAPGIAVGAMLGAAAADHLSSRTLELVFGVCESLIGLYFLVPYTEQRESDRPIANASPLTLGAAGIGIGALSTLMGIGGGVVTVPFLVALRLPLRRAISTSAASGLLIALTGAASFLYLGLQHTTADESLGYLYVPAFLCLSITSVLTAPHGAKLAYRLPTVTLRRIFGGLMLIVGIGLIKNAL